MIASRSESGLEQLFRSLFGEDERSYHQLKPLGARESADYGFLGMWQELLEKQAEIVVRAHND